MAIFSIQNNCEGSNANVSEWCTPVNTRVIFFRPKAAGCKRNQEGQWVWICNLQYNLFIQCFLAEDIEFYISVSIASSGTHQSGIAQKQIHLQSQPIESMKKGLVIRWLHVCIRVESGLWWSKRKLSLKWNHRIDLPESLPAAFAYKMVVDSLNMKTNIVNSISMNFDFCSGYAPDCIFKAYCPCLKIWNE